jgi:hypothetical protein
MISKIIKLLCLGTFTVFHSGLSQAEIINLEKSIEAEQLQIINATGNGLILARECPSCPEVRLNINSATTALHRNKATPLSSVPTKSDTAITVIYDPATLTAKRIRW